MRKNPIGMPNESPVRRMHRKLNRTLNSMFPDYRPEEEIPYGLPVAGSAPEPRVRNPLRSSLAEETAVYLAASGSCSPFRASDLQFVTLISRGSKEAAGTCWIIRTSEGSLLQSFRLVRLMNTRGSPQLGITCNPAPRAYQWATELRGIIVCRSFLSRPAWDNFWIRRMMKSGLATRLPAGAREDNSWFGWSTWSLSACLPHCV